MRAVWDWEDMAAFRRDGKSYLLIGDIGDNKANRETIKQPLKLLLVQEPDAGSLPAGETTLPIERTIQFRYEDGPHDCEALAVDAKRNVALLLTKELDTECSLYEVPLDAISWRAGRRQASGQGPAAAGDRHGHFTRRQTTGGSRRSACV